MCQGAAVQKLTQAGCGTVQHGVQISILRSWIERKGGDPRKVRGDKMAERGNGERRARKGKLAQERDRPPKF